MEELRVESVFRDEFGRDLPPPVLRWPLVLMTPLPCVWRGESEVRDDQYPTGYALVKDKNAAWPGDRSWIKREYPLFGRIWGYGMNAFEGAEAAAVADELIAIGEDDRLGSDPRLALAGRLIRRLGTRASYVNFPGE